MHFAMHKLSAARAAGNHQVETKRLGAMRDRIRLPYHVQSMSNKLMTDADLLEDYNAVRYGGAPEAPDIASYHRLTEAIASRIELPDWLAAYFFELRRDRSESRESWSGKLRLASAREQVARDLCFVGGTLHHLFHPDADAVLERLYALPDPTLVLTSHVGPRFARLWLTEVMKGKVLVLKMIGDDPPYKWETPLEAALVAARALAAGRKVYVAPDGPKGDRRIDIPVAGFHLDIARGVHDIAYDARANIAWLHVEVTDEGFLPILVEDGPSYQEGERSRAFADRINAFYARCVERIIYGPPDQLLFVPVMENRLRKIEADNEAN